MTPTPSAQFSGKARVDIVVVAQGTGYLADDIRYCNASPPSSVYPGESVSC